MEALAAALTFERAAAAYERLAATLERHGHEGPEFAWARAAELLAVAQRLRDAAEVVPSR